MFERTSPSNVQRRHEEAGANSFWERPRLSSCDRVCYWLRRRQLPDCLTRDLCQFWLLFQFERRWLRSVRRSNLRSRRTRLRQFESLRRYWPTRLPRVQPRCRPWLWLRPQSRPLSCAEAFRPMPKQSTKRTTSVLITLDSVRNSTFITSSPQDLTYTNGRALRSNEPEPPRPRPALWQTWCQALLRREHCTPCLCS